METDRFLLVGLGNPGWKYRQNRHNIGFMAVDRLAQVHGLSLGKVQFKAIVGDGRIGHQAVILAKPQTYMNLSGEAVGSLARFYKVEPSRLLVIYDEIDLPFGTLRLREQGSAGGHNGMKSIIQHLGDTFPRLRLGVSRPPGQMPAAAYVLQDFAADEQILLAEMLDETARAVVTFLTDGIQLAMSRHNKQYRN